MGQIVNALPTRSADDPGQFYALVENREGTEYTEANVITDTQISQAISKKWRVYHWDWDANNWVQYGSSTVRGDVNGDNSVTIADVTALIDLLLSGALPPTAADCNRDGMVNISDVTALIDYLLIGNWTSKARAVKPVQRTINGKPVSRISPVIHKLDRTVKRKPKL